MPRSSSIVSEIRLLREAVTRIQEIIDPASKHNISQASLDQATKRYQELMVQRDQWVSSSNIDKYLKGAGWYNEKFIREQFEFTAILKLGRTIYFHKDQLKKLAEELKKRKVDLKHFYDLHEAHREFEKEVKKYKEQKKSKWSTQSFIIPKWLSDISAKSMKLPKREAVETYIEDLRSELRNSGFEEYVDIHKGRFAVPKKVYKLEPYTEKGLARRLMQWSDKFNMANLLLHEISSSKNANITRKKCI